MLTTLRSVFALIFILISPLPKFTFPIACLQEVIKACRLAMAYRQKFRKDVVVDYICFRKWGHNEMDDPSFTNPVMYKVIRNRESIPDLYSRHLTVSSF